jgi:hypothetical protein
MTSFRLKHRLGALLAVLVLSFPGSAHAQTGAASITGLVTDASGAATPGVTITATNQATNVQYTAISNQAGNYTITNAPIGTYVVKAELTGFKTTSTKPLALEATFSSATSEPNDAIQNASLVAASSCSITV